MKKRCKVVTLPYNGKITDIPFSVKLVRSNQNEWIIGNPIGEREKAHHLYIVSDDDIKEGDHVIVFPFDDLRIKYIYEIIVLEDNQIYCKGDVKFKKQYYVFKKVIATTDPSLNLPLIPEQFVKDYCDANGIDKVVCEVNDGIVSISPLKESWSREEIEALCRKAFARGWDKATDDNFQYDLEEETDEFINNNL